MKVDCKNKKLKFPFILVETKNYIYIIFAVASLSGATALSLLLILHVYLIFLQVRVNGYETGFRIFPLVTMTRKNIWCVRKIACECQHKCAENSN